MKRLKKLTILLLILSMLCCMATTAFAADTGSITVNNPTAGKTYTAYKIFDVSYNEAKTAYAYSIHSDSEWYTAVSTYAQISENGLTLTASAADSKEYIVETTDKFSAASFAAALSSAKAGKTGTELTANGITVSATGLDLGYYFVTTDSGALCNLTTTAPAATIYDKNDIPFTKTADAGSVEVGQKVTYTITGKVPNTTGFTSYQYTIKDTMTDGLTLNKDVKVYIGTEEITTDFKVEYPDNVNGFELTIDVMSLQLKVAQDIQVIYTATVNESAVSAISENQATLTYSNDPTDTTKTATTPPIMIPVYTAKVLVDKFAADNTPNDDADNTRLSGAKFVLYKTTGGGSKKYYKYDDALDQVSWVDAIADASEVVTDDNGAASFIGLKDGTYYLHETEAPVGYNRLKDDVSVTIDGTTATKDDLSSLTMTSKVSNSTGAELPSTGGMGTTLFYVIGGILMLAAVVLLVTKKRMNAAK